MQELPKQFEGKGEVKGYTFTQREQSPYAYIYEKETNGRVSYEVFQRKENINEQWGINKVSYPTSKAFGIWAWECSNISEALNKFTELNEKTVND